MMLEVNARPGLAIQIANQCGLEERLQAVEALTEVPADVAERIALARALDAEARPSEVWVASPSDGSSAVAAAASLTQKTRRVLLPKVAAKP
jgi:hypothetical protein